MSRCVRAGSGSETERMTAAGSHCSGGPAEVDFQKPLKQSRFMAVADPLAQ